MNRVFTFVSVLLLIASCTSEIYQVNSISGGKPSDSKTVFFASTENTSFPETKVYADKNLKVLWNADDRISIFNMNTYNNQYSFSGDDGDTAGEFDLVGDDGEGEEVNYVYAVYPYNEETSLGTDGVLSMTLPAEQNYKENSFGIGANTMVALTAGNFLAFKNVGGYLNLRLYGDDVSVSRITIKGNNGEKIAGKASIEMPLGGVPTVTMDGTATDEISVVCNPAVKIGEDANNYTDFWFVIPPVYFSLGFTITVTDDKGGVFERATSKALTVNRNTLEWMAALEVVPDYTIANVPFEDENFKAYCVENFDKDKDGEISFAEALGVTEIKCDNMQIISLQGIEYFSNLTVLWCEKNKLTSLDLSNNSALIKLYCRNNLLTSLNVTRNTAITHLYCSTNQLGYLDVTNNTALSRLDCEINKLRAIDVTNNKELSMFACGYNQLNTIDISQNVLLTWFQCGGSNKLTGLDVSKNILLTTLRCYNNGLSALDISNNTSLSQLWCWDNNLTELDVTNNPTLKELDCRNNQLTRLDVNSCTILEELYCNKNPLESINASSTALIIFEYEGEGSFHELDVHNCKSLTELTCSSNTPGYSLNIDVRGCDALQKLNCKGNVTGLDNCLGLTHLYYGCDVSSLDLTGNTALVEVGCSGQFNSFNVSNLPYLASMYVSSNQLSDLSIKGCTSLGRLTVDNMSQLTSLEIEGSDALTEVWIYDTPITSLSINNCTSLQYLSYMETPLKSVDVSDCPSLITLYCKGDELINLDISRTALQYFQYDFECIKLKTFFAKDCKELQSVTINSPYLEIIDVTGCTSLSALKCTGSSQLTSLDVSTNTALTSLSCDSNQLSDLDVSKNTALTSLSCDSNQLSDLDVSKNTALTSLSCDSNQLSSLDVSNNTALTKLHCKFNLLTSLDVSNNLALNELFVFGNMSLSEIWLKTGQTIATINYMPSITTIKYKD